MRRPPPWVISALIQAAVFTAVFIGFNLIFNEGVGPVLVVLAAVLFLVFFGISARAQRRRD